MDLFDILIISLALLTSDALGLSVAGRRKATCGFPGHPKHGRVLHLLEKYEESMVVTYECDTDYYLLGPMTRTCQSNGTWSGVMPVCDQSVQILGLSSASEALNNYPPQLAVDGNFRTCFFSNRRKPRWWRVELPQSSLHNQSIISVALTLPPIIYVIEVETLTDHDLPNLGPTSTSSKYHKCATFRGVFSSKTIVVQCAHGGGGLKGNYLQIEDDYPQLEYFGLCEVDVFVEREQYDCGSIEVPANGNVVESNGSKLAEYSCNEGYRLMGESSRSCNLKTGQWIGEEPYCEQITCDPPVEIPNGMYRVYNDDDEIPIVGTRIVYECLPGFTLIGSNDTRVCALDSEWTGSLPHCEPIECGHPETLLMNIEDFMLSGAHFRLLNGTAKYSAVAELVCPTLASGNHSKNLYFRCREDGIWTEFSPSNETTKSISCVKQRHNGFLYYYGSINGKNGKLRKSFHFRETSINMLHLLAAVVIAAFLSILIIVVLLFKRNIIEWPEQECTTQPLKDLGQGIRKAASSVFEAISRPFHSLVANSKVFQRESKTSPKQTAFTITPSVSLDVENGRSRTNEIDTSDETKDELNCALATFYEEITSAAKQVFAEDTDRKLLRAARIAAELDAIKSQQGESNYHWIYATPPRGSSSLPPSLGCPSVHEYHQIPSTSQVYAKIDLIRKHRYRKERESSVYQVPRPVNIDPNCSMLSQPSNEYQLRKAFSTPDTVYATEGEYAIIRQLRQTLQTTLPPEPVHKSPLKTLL